MSEKINGQESTSNQEKVIYKEKGKVATLTINNPNKKNAIEKSMVSKILECLHKADINPKINCIIIKSVGDDVFCAGWDLGMFQGMDKEGIDFLLYKGGEISHRIHSIKKPVIVQVQGPSVGMGTIISLASDFLFVANKDRVFFQLPELEIGPGIFPATGPTVGAVKKLGINHAKDMLLTGRKVGFKEFDKWGVITQIVDPPEDLDNVVRKFARTLSRKSAELLFLTKTAINTMSVRLLDEFYNLENEMAEFYFSGMMGLEREPLEDFLEKIKGKYCK